MKKICFVTTVHGTLRSFILNFAEYMHGQMECEIYFICNHNEGFQKSLPGYIHYLPVSMKRGVSLGGISAMLEMLRIFKKEKFDMVQYSTPNASFYAAIASKIARIPVRLYCQWGMVYVSMCGLKRAIFKNVEKMICSLSTHIEPDSFGNLKFGCSEGLYPEGKGSVVWNGSTGGIDLKRFDVSQKEAWRKEKRRKYGIPENAFVYGFVGRITGDKGINELLAAFREIKKGNPCAYLMMVGESEKTETLDRDLLQWAEADPYVIFTGYDRAIEQYYAAMDVFVLPSYREGFGSVVIEAEAMEVPVIASDIPGPRDAMCKDVTGLMVPKRDIPGLMQAMMRLYKAPDLCVTLGEAGRRYVAERFEQQTFYAHTLMDRKRLMEPMSAPKKICFVTTVHGTLRSFVLKFAKYLHENTNYDISFICNPNEEFQASLPEYIHFIPVPMERGISLGGIGAMLKMVKIFRKEKFDLVQYSTPNAAFYAAIAAKLAGIRCRKYHLMGFRYLGFRGVSKAVFRAIEKCTCRLSTNVECVSPSNMEVGVTDGIFSRSKVQVIGRGSSAGIDLSRFDISRKTQWRCELRSQYGIQPEDCVFGFAGRITRDKGINELLQAFFDLPGENKRLLLIGDLEQVRTLDASLLKKAENDPRVFLIPYVTDIERYYAMIDVLLLPSYREGFGNIVIEAQAMGVPVIVSDIPGPIDAVEPGVTGLIVPAADTAALWAAMERLMNEPDLRERMGQAGYRFVSDNFDQQTLFGYILEDRKRLLGDR